MPATHSPPDSFAAATRGFRDLAMRRHAYYLDLLKTGRWRHYFSEQEFAEHLREVMRVTRAWDGLAKMGETPPVLSEGAKTAA